MSSEITVNIKCSNGKKFTAQASPNATISEFKKILAQESNVAAENQRLIFAGRVLNNEDATLESYGIYYFFFEI